MSYIVLSVISYCWFNCGPDTLFLHVHHVFWSYAPVILQVMAEKLPAAVLKRFQECVITGAPTTEEDQKVIADTIYEWVGSSGLKENGVK